MCVCSGGTEIGVVTWVPVIGPVIVNCIEGRIPRVPHILAPDGCNSDALCAPVAAQPAVLSDRGYRNLNNRTRP